MHRRNWIPILLLIAAMLAAHLAGLTDFLSLEAVRERRSDFLAVVEARPVLSSLVFMLVYVTVVSLSLPVASIMTLLGGFLFGPVLGTLLIVLAATMGATVIFLVARTSVGEGLREKAGPLYNRVADGMRQNAFEYLLFLRIVPLFPFFLVNILPALFDVRIRIFVLATLIGIVPGTFVYANLGRELGTISSLGDLLSIELFLAFLLLGVVALIPAAYRKWSGRASAKALAVAASCALTLGSFSGAAGEARADESYDRFVSVYDAMLKSHVAPARQAGINYNGVDYAAWRADERHPQALSALLGSDPASLEGRTAQLAYWINAYNFLTIDLIVKENETRSIKNLGNLLSTPWTRFKWKIAGRSLALDDIEHKIIRPFGEPRIHFAINCVAISCPDLRSEAYTRTDLERQLTDQLAVTFANASKGFRLEEGAVRVSKVMDWFAEDFAGGDVQQWLAAHSPQAIPAGSAIRFFDYDWSLNLR